jgi:hypothetical protein
MVCCHCSGINIYYQNIWNYYLNIWNYYFEYHMLRLGAMLGIKFDYLLLSWAMISFKLIKSSSWGASCNAPIQTLFKTNATLWGKAISFFSSLSTWYRFTFTSLNYVMTFCFIDDILLLLLLLLFESFDCFVMENKYINI